MIRFLLLTVTFAQTTLFTVMLQKLFAYSYIHYFPIVFNSQTNSKSLYVVKVTLDGQMFQMKPEQFWPFNGHLLYYQTNSDFFYHMILLNPQNSSTLRFEASFPGGTYYQSNRTNNSASCIFKKGGYYAFIFSFPNNSVIAFNCTQGKVQIELKMNSSVFDDQLFQFFSTKQVDQSLLEDMTSYVVSQMGKITSQGCGTCQICLKRYESGLQQFACADCQINGGTTSFFPRLKLTNCGSCQYLKTFINYKNCIESPKLTCTANCSTCGSKRGQTYCNQCSNQSNVIRLIDIGVCSSIAYNLIENVQEDPATWINFSPFVPNTRAFAIGFRSKCLPDWNFTIIGQQIKLSPYKSAIQSNVSFSCRFNEYPYQGDLAWNATIQRTVETPSNTSSANISSTISSEVVSSTILLSNDSSSNYSNVSSETSETTSSIIVDSALQSSNISDSLTTLSNISTLSSSNISDIPISESSTLDSNVSESSQQIYTSSINSTDTLIQSSLESTPIENKTLASSPLFVSQGQIRPTIPKATPKQKIQDKSKNDQPEATETQILQHKAELLLDSRLNQGTSDAKFAESLNSSYAELTDTSQMEGKTVLAMRLLPLWSLLTNVPYLISFQQLLPWPQLYHVQSVEKLLTFWVFIGTYSNVYPRKNNTPTILGNEINIPIYDEHQDTTYRASGLSSYFLLTNFNTIAISFIIGVIYFLLGIKRFNNNQCPLETNDTLSMIMESMNFTQKQKDQAQSLYIKRGRTLLLMCELLLLRVLDKYFLVTLLHFFIMHQYPPFYLQNDMLAFISFISGYIYIILYLMKQATDFIQLWRLKRIIDVARKHNSRVYEQLLLFVKAVYPFYLGDLVITTYIGFFYRFISQLKKLIMVMIILLGNASPIEREAYLLSLSVIFALVLIKKKIYEMKVKSVVMSTISTLMCVILYIKCITQQDLIQILQDQQPDIKHLNSCITTGWIVIMLQITCVSLSILYTIFYYLSKLIDYGRSKGWLAT